MKRGIMQVVLLSICLSPIFAQAQPPPHFTATYSLAANADPSGICTNEVRFWINNVTNRMFSCYQGTWNSFAVDAVAPSFPLLGGAADNCATTPYSFTGDSQAGLCSTAVGTPVIKSSGTLGAANTSRLSMDPTFVQLGTWNVAEQSQQLLMNGTNFAFTLADVFNQFAITTNQTFSKGVWVGPVGSASAPAFSFTDDDDTGMYQPVPNALSFSTAGVLRLTLVNDEFFTSLSGASNTTAALSLRDLTSNTFLSFTNVGTPANVISFAQNSSTPLLDMTVTDGASTGRFRNQPGGNAVSMNHTSGSESSNISVEVDGPVAVVTSTNGTSNSTINVGGTGTTTISVNDGSGAVVSYFSIRGFVVPYAGDVASASTITTRGNVFHVTGTTTINTITASNQGMCLTLIFDDVVTVGDLTGNINIAAAFVSTANDTLSLCHDGTTWFETARSVN